MIIARNGKKPPWWLPIAVVVVLAVLLVKSGIENRNFERLKVEGATVAAKVCEVVQGKDSSHGKVYVSYEYQGQQYARIFLKETNRLHTYAEGETVSLLLNRSKPAEPIENQPPESLWRLLGVGSIVLIITTAITYGSKVYGKISESKRLK